MLTKSNIIIGLLLLIIAVIASTAYVVKETDRAVKLKFGEVVEADVQPGLHWKVPIMHRIRKFDSRLMTLDEPAESFLTLEKKPLDIDSYTKWRIVNVQKYYTATNGEESRTHALLSQRVNEGLRNEVGKRDMHEVVSGKRDELMLDLTARINKQVKEELGIQVVDIRVKKVDLPPNVEQSVYDRMNTERERKAREHRSRGQEQAEKIRAAADKEKVIIESEAYRKAEITRGNGEAQAAAIYAEAYEKNSEFYAFWRSLRAYEATFANKSDIMLLKPDSDFFRYLNDSKAK